MCVCVCVCVYVCERVYVTLCDRAKTGENMRVRKEEEKVCKCEIGDPRGHRETASGKD